MLKQEIDTHTQLEVVHVQYLHLNLLCADLTIFSPCVVIPFSC